MMTKLSRKQRRINARMNGETFQPQYSSGVRVMKGGRLQIVGGEPRTYEEVYGIGRKRFSNKFVKFAEVAE